MTCQVLVLPRGIAQAQVLFERTHRIIEKLQCCIPHSSQQVRNVGAQIVEQLLDLRVSRRQVRRAGAGTAPVAPSYITALSPVFRPG